MLAVVKANAYGHGAAVVARALEAADGFAVARMEEAVALREGGCGGRIALLEGFEDDREIAVAAQLDFEPFVHEDRQIALLEAHQSPHKFRVWLKIDSGMHRLGFLPPAAARAARRLASCARVAKPVHLATHLARADEKGCAATADQIACFREAIAGLDGERSIANSAALIAWPDARAEWVRPGVMLYGVSPFPDSTSREFGLRPVMRFETRVIAVKEVAAGASVGYGGTWTAARPSRIAVAAVGYGDGYPRSAPNGTPVAVNGVTGRLAGRPSMDMLTIDVTDLPKVAVGDPVELWGETVPVERVAAAAGTIAYELTCRVGRRVVFVTSGV